MEKKVMDVGIEPATPGLGVQLHFHWATDSWEGGIYIAVKPKPRRSVGHDRWKSLRTGGKYFISGPNVR